MKEDLNDIIKIIKLLEDSNLLLDSITETVKHEIKKKREVFFLQPVISSVVKGISGRGVRSRRRGYIDKKN